MRNALAASLLVLLAGPLFIAGCGGDDKAKESQDPTGSDQQQVKAEPLSYPNAIAVMGSCVGAALAAAGCGYAIARIGAACVEAIARQPEAGGSMFAPMVVTAAMVESGMLAAILVCLLGVLSK